MFYVWSDAVYLCHSIMWALQRSKVHHESECKGRAKSFFSHFSLRPIDVIKRGLVWDFSSVC